MKQYWTGSSLKVEPVILQDLLKLMIDASGQGLLTRSRT
jgi:hypothetical protein